jgi:glycosyltransferase involved in cell wall biosynthesis
LKKFGTGVARNMGVLMLKDDLFPFDADDLWKPNKLQRQIDFLANNAPFTFSYDCIDEEGH